jgi:aminotransferase
MMKKVHVFSTLCTPTVSQFAALEALGGSQKYMGRMVDDYNKRRLYMLKRFDDMPGIRYVKPQGAFYAFPNIEYFKMGSLKFSEWLLKEARVAVMPGIEFGLEGEGYARCSYATAMDRIVAALDRMERCLRGL